MNDIHTNLTKERLVKCEDCKVTLQRKNFKAGWHAKQCIKGRFNVEFKELDKYITGAH